ncbi:MAG: hypothetical protein E7399_02640 [Ruminococcaceae bacterium]|nr:hypothetical protein [Oscillospiraceae bacterium]
MYNTKENYKERIAKMTTEQKLGMLFCARKFEEEDIQFIIEMLKKKALGCIQLPAGYREITSRILAEIDYPVLIINDTETGFPTSKLPKIPLMSLAACNKKEYYHAFAKGIVRDAKEAGFNGTWGPVVDVLHGDGPCTVHRVFSDDPMKVSNSAEEIATIYKQNHYLSCGKHYPGGGDCPYDTHMTEGFSDLTEQEVIEFDIVPYMYLYKKDLLPSIMTTHTVFRKIDPDFPASLSKKVIDMIRNLGFDGVAFTDSFAMMGILQKYGEENIYGMAVAAGNDIILPNYRTPVKQAFEMLKKNYEDGAFSEERLNEAVRRVLTAQDFVAQKPENPTVFTEEDEKTLYRVAQDCITAVTDEGVPAALTGEHKDKLFIVVESQKDIGEIGQEINMARWYDARKIGKKIMEEFPEAGLAFLPEYPNSINNEKVLNLATKYKEVIFVTYCTTTSYLGTDCMTRRLEMVINCLAHSNKVSTVLHFGNPYALQPLLHIPRKIFGYMISESQIHAIDVLAGKLEAKGALPYTIDFQ